MTPQELIRKLIELLSDESSEPEEVKVPTVSLTQVEVDNEDESNGESMVSPLQQKLELLKKSVGVESAFDNSPESDCEKDELDFIKKAAGIPSVVSMADSDGIEE
jgi:hypothetical protein